MKKSLLFLLAVFAFVLSGCTRQSSDNAIEQFLAEFYSVEDLEQAQNSIDNLARSDDAVTEYHESISRFVTESCLDNIITNRYLLQVQKAATEKGRTFSVSDIKLDVTKTATEFSLTVTATEQAGGKTYEIEQSGQISASEDGKISNVFFNNLEDLTS